MFGNAVVNLLVSDKFGRRGNTFTQIKIETVDSGMTPTSVIIFTQPYCKVLVINLILQMNKQRPREVK